MDEKAISRRRRFENLICKPYLAAPQVKQRLRKMKEKAISRGKWQGSGGPKVPAMRGSMLSLATQSFVSPHQLPCGV